MRNAPAGRRDRAVTGAAAEVAGERFMHDRGVRRLAAVVEGKHRHDETRRAEAALGGIGIDERLLHRMERSVRPGQTLDRQDGTIVDLRQHPQAGIPRLELQRSVDAPTEDDGTGAAVALRAAFLGSGEMGAGAKPVEHRHARRRAILAAWRSVQQEPHRGHARLFSHPGGRQPWHARACSLPLEDNGPRAAWAGPAAKAQGAAAMTSTSTRNSGRENPETIISVEAGGGSAM